MDNLTHSLTGLALARAGLNRLCPHATLLLILSANAPDGDIVMLTKGQLEHFEWHRGYTHSAIGLPFMAALSVLVVAAIFWQKLPRRNSSWLLRAWLVACAGVASHDLLDWTNDYGVRLFLPFSSRWFHCDLNGLFDSYILVALLLAAIWPLFARLVSGEIGERPSASAGRRIAIFALAFFVLFDCARTALHARAIAQLESRLYEGQPPLEAAVLPHPFSPLWWTGVVETSDSYRMFRINPLEDLMPEAGQTFFKAPLQRSLEAAKQTEPFRYLLYFSRFPVWSQEPVTTADGPATRIDLTDLRFGTPGAGSFHSIALENGRDQILGVWFTYGSGAQLGWGAQPK
jgi:inner membrane protein